MTPGLKEMLESSGDMTWAHLPQRGSTFCDGAGKHHADAPSSPRHLLNATFVIIGGIIWPSQLSSVTEMTPGDALINATRRLPHHSLAAAS